MRAIGYIFATLASILLILGILVSCVDAAAFDVSFYRAEYAKLGVAGATDMSMDSLMDTTRFLLRYIRGGEPELDVRAEIGGRERTVFDEREQAHMVDVRNLYLGISLLRYAGFAVAGVLYLLAALCFRRERLRGLAKSYLAGVVLTGGLFCALGAWIYSDFFTFWTMFHRVFFTNDLWLLDPAVSVMINMFPEQFFFDMVVRILALFAAVAGGIALLCAAYLVYKAIRRRRLVEIRGER